MPARVQPTVEELNNLPFDATDLEVYLGEETGV